MNSELKPVNRKTGNLIAKNIVILTVLIIVCALSIWAWFTQSTTATADGINVIAKAEGVEVSWDGVDYYYDLTAREEKDYKANITGYAKNLCDADGNPAPLKLVTGNGLDFFEPYVNRRTGTVLFDGDDKTKNWQGIDIYRGDNSDGKYIDLDVYFRGTNASNIYLAQDSKVTPQDNTTNGPHKSVYGNFSKDNIASATRLAFLDVNKTVDAEGNETESIGDCNFIWAPNANQILEGNSAGYDRYVKTDETPDFEPGDLGDVIDFTTQKDDYYLWLPTQYESDEKTQEAHLDSNKMEFKVYDEINNKGLYTFDFHIKAPTVSKDVTLLYYINKKANDNDPSNGEEWDCSDLYTYIDVSKSKNNNDYTDLTPNVALADTFNLNSKYVTNYLHPIQIFQNDRKAPAFFIGGDQFKGKDITVTIGYNPDAKEVIIIGYHCEGIKTYNRVGKAVQPEKYYELPNQTTNVALVSPQTGIAISADQYNKKQVTFSDNPANNNVTSLSITLSEQFTANKIGEGKEATYTFRNKKTGNYITISGGNFDWSGDPVQFSLHYDADFSGPLLKYEDYFLAVKNNEVVAVHKNNLDVSNAITVYIGSEYRFGPGNIENYKYYDNQLKKLVDLYPNPDINSTVKPRLYTTDAGEESQLEFGTCIAELTEENNYTAHIIVRLWVEGTDREAQTPLADGIFDISLHFTTKFLNK